MLQEFRGKTQPDLAESFLNISQIALSGGGKGKKHYHKVIPLQYTAVSGY